MANGKSSTFHGSLAGALFTVWHFPSSSTSVALKPREVGHLDTMNMWSFGHAQELHVARIAHTPQGFPTPKIDISGADVARVYYRTRTWIALPRIARRMSWTLFNCICAYAGVLIPEDGFSLVSNTQYAVYALRKCIAFFGTGMKNSRRIALMFTLTSTGLIFSGCGLGVNGPFIKQSARAEWHAFTCPAVPESRTN
ncbi:MAG: hypothetical protein IPP33_16835 [Flavobacteriales bacterium]|nr:hypothetical protein [Flavobacteriales bacterium]